MKIQSDLSPLHDHAATAFYAAAGDTLQYAKAIAPNRTGTFRKSLKMWRRKRKTGPTARIGSMLPRTSVLERGGGPAGPGGWAKRGPHVQRANAPRTLGKAGAKFPDFMERRLRFTPIRSHAIVAHDFGGETGIPFLGLGVEL